MPDMSVPNGHEGILSEDTQTINSDQVTVAQPKKQCTVSVEPALFMTTFSSALSGSVFTQLLLVRSCEVTFGYNLSECALLENKTNSTEARDLEALVQPHVTVLQMYKSITEALIPAVLSLFVGAWSDLYGRKPLIMWPLFGYGIQLAAFAILSAVPHLSPIYFVIASLPVALSGGLITIISGVYSYISDISSSESRAFRMGMLDASVFGGFMVGVLCSAPLFSVMGRYGYLGIFSISSSISLLGFLYVVFLPESVNVDRSLGSGGLCSLFDKSHVIRMMSTCCKRRENYGRAIIFLMIISISTCILTMEGESSVSFLYTRAKFHWDLFTYNTYYCSFSLVMSVLGGTLGMYVFSMKLQIPDSIFAAVVFLTKCIQTVIFAFSPTQWYMYGGALLGVFGGIIGPLCRSVLSKAVPQKDIGTVFALTGVMEALTPLAASPLYNLVYSATLHSFPGTFYLMSTALFLLDIVLVCIVIVMQHFSSTLRYSVLQTEE